MSMYEFVCVGVDVRVHLHPPAYARPLGFLSVCVYVCVHVCVCVQGWPKDKIRCHS